MATIKCLLDLELLGDALHRQGMPLDLELHLLLEESVYGSIWDKLRLRRRGDITVLDPLPPCFLYVGMAYSFWLYPLREASTCTPVVPLCS